MISLRSLILSRSLAASAAIPRAQNLSRCGAARFSVPSVRRSFFSFAAEPEPAAANSDSTGTGLAPRSPQDELVIRDLFLSFATQNTGSSTGSAADPCLQVEDLRDLLLAIGDRPSDARLRTLIEQVDTDRSGIIEYDEFVAGYETIRDSTFDDDDHNNHRRRPLDVDALVSTFKVLDRDSNGVITHDELCGLLSAGGAGGSLTPEDAHDIMTAADEDGSGSIDLTEFIHLMTNPRLGRYSWRLRSGFRVFLVLGGPGSGGGELCELLAERAGVRRCSSDEMLREEIESGSALGASIERAVREEAQGQPGDESSPSSGGGVPSTTIIALLKKQLSKCPGSFVALEGFPRTLDNYRDFDAVCGAPEFALYLDVPDEVMIERIMNDNEQTSGGRGGYDNNSHAAVTERIRAYRESTEPTLRHLEKCEISTYRCDGRGSVEEVWERCLEVCDPISSRFVIKQADERVSIW